jgi:anthranilate 1,2-dioxygenase small subunit
MNAVATARRPTAEVRHMVSDLLAEYAGRIDANELEQWLDLFTEQAGYRVVLRENVEQGLPGIIIWCDSRNMLRDRVESYRHVNEYNLHWDRHVIGPARFMGHEAGVWTVEASYILVQTAQENGESRLFSVGMYRFQIVIDAEVALLAGVEVIADTGLIPTLLATPI